MLDQQAQAVAFSPNGETLASGGYDHTLRLWDVATRHELPLSSAHTHSVNHLAISLDGKTLACGGNDGSVSLWDVATGRKRRQLEGHGGRVTTATAFSPAASILASGGPDGTVQLWDVTTGTALKTLTGHKNEVTSLAFSSDGQTMASGSTDKTVRLWNMATAGGEAWLRLEGHSLPVRSVAFSPDGKTLASGGDDKSVKLWDLATGQLRTTLDGHKDKVRSVAFTPDGQTLISAGADKTVVLWNLSRNQVRLNLEGHTAAVTSVAVSPYGRLLASAGEDGTVRLRDTATGRMRQLLQLGPIRGLVNDVAFTPDGRHLATANGNGTVYILRLPPDGQGIGGDLPPVPGGKEVPEKQSAASVGVTAGGLLPEPGSPLPTRFTNSIGMDFTELFDKKDLRASLPQQREKPWFVVDRVLGNDSGNGSIFTKKTYTNFDLRMEFQVSENTAAAVDIWSYPGDTPVWVFLENTRNAMGAITFAQDERTFNVYRLNPPAALKPDGQWNELTIEVSNADLSVSLNGRALDTRSIRNHVEAKRPDSPPAERLSGHIGLTKRWGNGKILIRKLSIEDLRETAVPKSSGGKELPTAAADRLPRGSVWKGTRTYRKGTWAGGTVTYELYIRERDGTKFKGHKFDNGAGRNRLEIEGEIVGRTISWRERESQGPKVVFRAQGTLQEDNITFTFEGDRRFTEGDGKVLREKAGEFEPSYRVANAIEAENLKVLQESGDFSVEIQNIWPSATHKWSGDAQLWVRPTRPNEWVDLELPVAGDGKYHVLAYITKAPDYGIVQFSLNGKPLGQPIDCFDGSGVNTACVDLGRVQLKIGPVTLRMEVTGTNQNSVGQRYMCGLDCIVLEDEGRARPAVAQDPRAPASTDGRFVPLFNGKDLTGWTKPEAPTTSWNVEKGIVTGRNLGPIGSGSQTLETEKQFTNFRLRLETMMSDGQNNSGFGFRGLAVVIAATSQHPEQQFPTGTLRLPPKATLALADPEQRRPGKWIALEIEVTAHRCRVWRKRKLVVDCPVDNLGPGTEVKPTRIGLACRPQSIVRFRNIEIKELPAK